MCSLVMNSLNKYIYSALIITSSSTNTMPGCDN